MRTVILVEFIQEAVASLFASEQKIDAKKLKSVKEEVAKNLKDRGHDLFAAMKPRSLEFQYRGVCFPVVVTTFVEVLNLLVWATIKEVGVLTMNIPECFCEAEPCPKTKSDIKASVDEVL